MSSPAPPPVSARAAVPASARVPDPGAEASDGGSASAAGAARDLATRAAAALSKRRALGAALLGGVVFALSSPPTDFYPAVVLGLALLALSVSSAPTPARAFGRAVAWGTAAQLVGLRFVPSVIVRFTPLPLAAGVLALALLSAAQSITWGLGMALASALARRVRAPLELAFTCGAVLALSLPSVFAWSPAGLVTPWPAFVQLADLVGERGVSALFAVGAALLARAWITARARRSTLAAIPRLGAAALLFAAIGVYGVAREASVTRAHAGAPTVSVGLVDHAIAPLERWDPKQHPRILRALHELTTRVEAEGADLVVWPEAAYPYVVDHERLVVPRGERGILASDVRPPIVLGLITVGPTTTLDDGTHERNSYNSTTLIGDDGALEPTADKLQLLWFGEMVPGGEQIPWLRRQFQRSGGLVPGSAPRALTLDAGPRRASTSEQRPALRMAILNCYEDTLTDVGRRNAAELAPNLLVNVTNDAWFYDTAESELHARLAAMRAVEARRDLVRAVNLGVMTWVDAAGVTRARYAEPRAGTLLATPAVFDGPSTVYVACGDVPMFALLAALVTFFAWRARREPRVA